MKHNKMRNSKLTKYAFFLGSAATLVGRAAADTVASFGFENLPSSGSTTTASFGPYSAEAGSGTAISVHASTATAFSSPAGSGSLRSLSANNYAAGDYFQFTINATGYSSLALAFDSVASGTGPKVFNLTYSTDGSSFTLFSSYTLNTGTTTAFATSATNSAVNYAFDLSALTGLNNRTDYFRLVEADTTTATTGTARVDNFILTGTSATATAPEPSSMVILSIAGAGAVMAARRRSRA